MPDDPDSRAWVGAENFGRPKLPVGLCASAIMRVFARGEVFAGFRTRADSTPMNSHEKDRLYQEGVEAFNSSQFFEAHELWEDLWRETPEPNKRYLQGLIQVAAAFHHYSRANLRGTRKLLQEGLLKLEAFPEIHGGLEIEPLRAAVREWLSVLAIEDVPEDMKPPRIARFRAR
jgi:uncharacterized protein